MRLNENMIKEYLCNKSNHTALKTQGETFTMMQPRENLYRFHITAFHSVQIITAFQGLEWHFGPLTICTAKGICPSRCLLTYTPVVQRTSPPTGPILNDFDLSLLLPHVVAESHR